MQFKIKFSTISTINTVWQHQNIDSKALGCCTYCAANVTQKILYEASMFKKLLNFKAITNYVLWLTSSKSFPHFVLKTLNMK